jgi:hypothetical protein
MTTKTRKAIWPFAGQAGRRIGGTIIPPPCRTWLGSRPLR